MKGLGIRVLTAAVLLPLVLFLIHLGPWGLAPLLALIAALGGREFARLLSARGRSGCPWIAGGSAVLMVAAFGGILPIGLAGAFVLVVGIAIAREFIVRPGDMSGGVGAAVFSAVYLGLFPAHLLRFYTLGGGGTPDPWPVYYALVLVWGCDTAAYLVGSRIGRHRLWPRVSPSKSWEGAVAGIVAAAVLAITLGRWVPGLSLQARLGAGLLVGVFAQMGDLAESMMKREAERKDSGRIFPGHGGVLDRIDSLILAVPILYYWLAWAIAHPS